MKRIKHILYIGNKLSRHNKNITAIDTLGALLEKHYLVSYASSKQNIFLRLLDMVWQTLTRAGKVDVVLIDTYSTLNFYYALVISQLCRILGVAYIPILRGGNLPAKMSKSRFQADLIFKNSKINIIPSAYLAHFMKNNGYYFTVIPNNIEIKDYKFKKREKFSPRLLYVRSFHKIYNPNMAVKVLGRVKEKYPDAELCMIGPDKDGSKQEALQLAKELDVQDNIETPGFLGKKKWHQKSTNFDIFISTTDHDNTPISVIEAMALGLPVVSTSVGGVPYLIDNNSTGILVNRNDDEAMSNAIMRLINDPEFAHQIAISARKKVENFDWEVVKEDWFEVIESTADRYRIYSE
jgi:glycosyltransferase involved in cell wall biosynthesis